MAAVAKLSPLEILDDVYMGLLIDASHSMGPMKQSTLTGYAELIEDQRKGPSIRFSTLLFNEKVLRIHAAVSMHEVSPLVSSEYKPSGCTALYDALGEEIESVEALEVAPVSVVIAVISDGDDNESKRYTLAHIRDLIVTKQRLGWTFVFYAANQKAESAAQDLGFEQANVKRYGQTALGTSEAFKSLSEGVRKFIKVAAQGILPSGDF